MRYFTLLLCIFTLMSVTAQNVTTTTASGNWNVASNWTNGVPTNLDSAYVEHDMTLTNNLDVSTGGYYFVTDAGTITDNSGGTAYSIDVRNTGQFIVSGTVFIEGTFSIENNAHLEIIGCDTLEVGNMSVQNSSTFMVQSCAVLQVNNNFNLGNNQANTVNGYIRVEGNVLAINSAQIVGTGSLSASGSVTINNTASIFGSTADCPDTPVDCVYGTGTVLPVEWLTVSAELVGDAVYLEWVTASEQNNDRFEVERLINDAWEVIGVIEGAGNTNVSKSYFYMDEQPRLAAHEPLVYRIGQVDYDGTISYADPVSVSTKGNALTASLGFFPNPANNTLRLNVSEEVQAVTLISLDGRMVGSHLVTGSNMNQIDVSDLDAGIYFVNFIGQAGLLDSQRLVVQH